MKLVLFADGVVGMQIAEYLAEKYPQDLSLVVTVAENEIFDFAQAVRVSACVFDSQENISARFSGEFEAIRVFKQSFRGRLFWPPVPFAAPRQSQLRPHR